MHNYIPKNTPVIGYKLHQIHPKNLNAFSTKTGDVLEVLLKGKGITARNAAYDLDIFCLAQIIAHIRHHRKIPVKTKIHKVVNLNGKITIYAEYFLTASDIAAFYAKSFH